jgi:hypothetical protein
MEVHKNLKIELPYDAVLMLLGISQKNHRQHTTETGACSSTVHNSHVMEIA